MSVDCLEINKDSEAEMLWIDGKWW